MDNFVCQCEKCRGKRPMSLRLRSLMVYKTPNPSVRQMRTAFLSAYATRDWERFLRIWLAYKRATY